MLDWRLFLSFSLLTTAAHSQWLNFPDPGTPRLPDGKANLAAPTPRALDGHPDLSGVWMHELTSVDEIKRIFGHRFDADIEVSVPGMEIGTQHKYAFDILLDFKPADSPLRPETAEAMRQSRTASGPPELCSGVMGFPLGDLLSEPIKIVQGPRLTMVLYEAGNYYRQIHTDGRTLPKEFDFPAYMGYSAGRWEGDTFVVETAGFNNKTKLDTMGRPHGESLHVTERFRRRDFGNLDYEMTFDDPQFYTRPFTIKVPHYLLADSDIFESFCKDNEKDLVHLKK